MPHIRIYTRQGCPFSDRALLLLQEKGLPFEEIDVTESLERKEQMVAEAHGRTSTPQVFIDGEHIGGADDLEAADRAGRLAGMLADATPSL